MIMIRTPSSAHFDFVVSALAFSHIEPVFAEIARILREDGRIVISDFHPYWPVFGHGYTEFFDESGQEYRIINYPYLFEKYFTLCQRYGFSIVDVREPKINRESIKRFPSFKDYRGLPLALILKLSKLA